jgi:hypothetical protein
MDESEILRVQDIEYKITIPNYVVILNKSILDKKEIEFNSVNRFFFPLLQTAAHYAEFFTSGSISPCIPVNFKHLPSVKPESRASVAKLRLFECLAACLQKRADARRHLRVVSETRNSPNHLIPKLSSTT